MMKARNFALVLGAALVLFAGGLTSAAFVKSVHCEGVGVCQNQGVSGGGVLYSQTDDPSGSAFTDQEFEAVYAAYSAEGADDFVVTGTQGWDLTTLATPGIQTAGGTPFFVNHYFYADAAGLPGAVIDGCDFPANTNFTHDLGNITVNVEDCNVEPGAAWFSQQVRQDFQPFGQHFWATRLNAANNPGAFRNPGNGFGSGCIDWAPANSACGMIGQDYQFELSGSERATAAPGPVPAVGPFGIALMVLGLGAGSAYVMRRRSA
jgi:hypothetical protein